MRSGLDDVYSSPHLDLVWLVMCGWSSVAGHLWLVNCGGGDPSSSGSEAFLHPRPRHRHLFPGDIIATEYIVFRFHTQGTLPTRRKSERDYESRAQSVRSKWKSWTLKRTRCSTLRGLDIT
jgi:hypothetical protein